jgi:DNA-binding LytR/AlgR family response regulator
MNILICDDNERVAHDIANRLRSHAEASHVPAKIAVVTQPAALEDGFLAQFDLAFLDIDMGDSNGVEIARRIRAARNDSILVFVTNYIEYAPSGYEVQAFRYLLKSELDAKLLPVFDLAIDAFAKKHRVVSITIAAENIDVPIQNILYFESDQRTLVMHLLNSNRPVYRFYGNITKLSEELEVLGFLRIHKSYLVNMEYLEVLQYGKARMRGGVFLPSSEKNHTQLKSRYLAWRGKNKWNIC